jgi:hypothetical protein
MRNGSQFKKMHITDFEILNVSGFDVRSSFKAKIESVPEAPRDQNETLGLVN